MFGNATLSGFHSSSAFSLDSVASRFPLSKRDGLFVFSGVKALVAAALRKDFHWIRDRRHVRHQQSHLVNHAQHLISAACGGWMRVYELQWAAAFQTIHLAPNRNRRLGGIASTRRQFSTNANRLADTTPSILSKSAKRLDSLRHRKSQARRPLQT